MPLPSPLPSRFEAALTISVRAVVAHPILKGGRQRVDAGPLQSRAEVDGEAGTLRILDFPIVSDRVGTMIGAVSASVEIPGKPTGSFDAATGHVLIQTELTISPKTMLARDSDIVMVLASDASVETPEVTAAGGPLDGDEATLRLVGQGRFGSGTLIGGMFTLVLDCTVDSVDSTR